MIVDNHYLNHYLLQRSRLETVIEACRAYKNKWDMDPWWIAVPESWRIPLDQDYDERFFSSLTLRTKIKESQRGLFGIYVSKDLDQLVLVGG